MLCASVPGSEQWPWTSNLTSDQSFSDAATSSSVVSDAGRSVSLVDVEFHPFQDHRLSLTENLDQRRLGRGERAAIAVLGPGGGRPARRGDRIEPEDLSAPATPRCAAASSASATMSRDRPWRPIAWNACPLAGCSTTCAILERLGLPSRAPPAVPARPRVPRARAFRLVGRRPGSVAARRWNPTAGMPGEGRCLSAHRLAPSRRPRYPPASAA
jgi:hypothetical protein